jgi:hypothetical protein
MIMSEAFVSRLQFLGARKEVAELDEGRTGQDKDFWEDVSVKFNDYLKPDYFKHVHEYSEGLQTETPVIQAKRQPFKYFS